MNLTPLEDRVHDALHRTADPLHRSPFTVTDVRTRARRIRRRRRSAAAAAAVAAVLAIAVPVGASMVDPTQRSEVPPVTRPPAPLVATGTVLVDPRSADVVESTSVPLVDVDAPSLITPDGALALPGPFSSITPYLDGWVGVTMNEGTGAVQHLSADLEPQDDPLPSGGLVVSPDGRRVAWSEYDGSRWRVVVADPSGGTGPVHTTFPPAPQTHMVVPVGFVSEDQVVVRAYDDTTTTTTYAAGGGRPVEVPGLVQAASASPATGVVAGLTEFRQEGSCSAVVDGLAGTGARAWETCDHQLGPFSASGTYVVGLAAYLDGNGSPTLAVLDAATGEQLVEFEVVLPRRTVGGFWTRMAWEGDEALVVRMFSGDDYYMLRLGLDGTVQRVDIASAGASGLSVAEVR